VIVVKLPSIEVRGDLLRTIMERRSIRRYSRKPLSIEQLSLLLWSSYGCVDQGCRHRTVPSAGATYPMEIYVSIRENGVEGVEPGIYYYEPGRHVLILKRRGDYGEELYRACLNQKWVRDAPLNIIVASLYEKTTAWYGERGFRYIFIEAGHIGQNIYLVATMLGLGTVGVGAFIDEGIRRIIGLSDKYLVIYVLPVGYRT
jgi:SagB-type dehydrogenase family enzyme